MPDGDLMNSWKTIEDVHVAGRRVLTRLDINVPIENGKVSDDTRVRMSGDTVSDITRRGGIPVIMSHMGRPNGRPETNTSLGQLVPVLEQVFGMPVNFCPETVGPIAEAKTKECRNGELCLIENLRFNPGETNNDAGFAAKLARLGEVYCNDAFSVSHRTHASIVGVAELLPAFAGRQLERELHALEAALGSPQRPVIAIVGGSKISTKLAVLENLVTKVDKLVVGGAMANTFLLAKGFKIGRSLVERKMIPAATSVMKAADKRGCHLILPEDIVVSRELKVDAEATTVAADACPDDMIILDAGANSTRRIVDAIAGCRTLIWNGPVGAFEMRPFDMATNAIAGAAATLTEAGSLTSVAGGGDTAFALGRSGTTDAFTFVSTAGGAFLEWMEGRNLPGLEALAG